MGGVDAGAQTIASTTTTYDGQVISLRAFVDGRIAGAGTVGPGMLDAVQFDPMLGTDFLFQFTAANTQPDYLNRTASLNDVLH